MNSLLDGIGSVLYVFYKFLELPMMVLLQAFFALLFLTRYTYIGYRKITHIKWRTLVKPIHIFPKQGYNLGRRFYAWALHK